MNNKPRVSIGLPVYNGSNYVREAIGSILNQTYRDFELIICDNASTDNTQQICEEYAAKDARIRYYRNPKNVGANPNYNLAFHYAHGEYFKWAAHDDVLHPQFLEKCVAALDADPGVVLAHPKTILIDSEGKEIPDVNMLRGYFVDSSGAVVHLRKPDPVNRKLHTENLAARFHSAVILNGWCFEIFGLIRTDALNTTGLMADYYGTDKVILARLAVLGRYATPEGTYFYRRSHRAQSTNITNAAEREKWAGTDTPAAKPVEAAPEKQKVYYRDKVRKSAPRWRCFQGYFSTVWRYKMTSMERFGCMTVIARWPFQFHKWQNLFFGTRRFEEIKKQVESQLETEQEQTERVKTSL